MTRCTGHCCRRFVLPLWPDSLRRAYEEWRAQAPPTVPPVADIHLIFPMVRYMGPTETDPHDGHPLDAPMPSYTCVHLTPGGDCGIHEHRPQMCRDFPYGHTCPCPGCTWDPAEAAQETATRTPPRPIPPPQAGGDILRRLMAAIEEAKR